MAESMSQAIVQDCWQTVEGEARQIARSIWENPELGMMEYHAEALLSAWLRNNGFVVDRGTCDMPTAFRAQWSNGEGPVLGFMAEYDALPGQGNLCEPRRAPDGKNAGHACGHNHIAAAGAGAAIALRHAMEQQGIRGTIVCLGTPAEEILWGKIAMLQRGAFDGIDVLFANHADYQNGAISRPCLSCVSSELVFSGVASHGGSLRSRNALDAAELFIQSVERLRAHQFNDAVIGHVLRTAGYMPSITPDEVRLWMTVRHERFERAEAVWDMILPVARDAARYTGTTVTNFLISASRGYLPNQTLGEVLYRNMKTIGPPKRDDVDREFMVSLSRQSGGSDALDWDDAIALHTDGCDPYGQDDGEASWYIPLARANWSAPTSIPLHNWAFTAASGHPSQFKGAAFAGESLAMAGMDLLRGPAIVAEAQSELRRRTAGIRLSPPRCGGFDVMTSNPSSFWDATWMPNEQPGS